MIPSLILLVVAQARPAEELTWTGEVLLGETFVVKPGTTLRILPGTRVKFRAYRGYREPEKRVHLIVQGGVLAEGTPERPIYFTSDDPKPRNGDWGMVRVATPSAACRFRFCVFEFAQQGLNVWKAEVRIAQCVFRWNNWEGLYFESHCKAQVEDCLLQENGYNGMAAEQFNALTMDRCEVRRNGTNGVHVDASRLEIRRSRVLDNGAHGLSVDDNGEIIALGVATRSNSAWGIGVGEGKNVVRVGNVEATGNGAGAIQGNSIRTATAYTVPQQVKIGFRPEMAHALGYVPGDPRLDPYLYVYPDDETRKIARKIGAGLGLTWSVAWDGESLWTATLSGRIGKLDPVTGAQLAEFKAPGPQPWGMTFDGQDLWLVDFAEKRISRIDRTSGRESATFATPDPAGGCKGVAWDGTHLNVLSGSSGKIYRMTREGTLEATVELDHGGYGGIAWDGTHFWIPSGRIHRYDTRGRSTGWIYPASEGTWDLTWDGRYLWACQRTNENWNDAKLFALQPLELQTP